MVAGHVVRHSVVSNNRGVLPPEAEALGVVAMRLRA